MSRTVVKSERSAVARVDDMDVMQLIHRGKDTIRTTVQWRAR